MTHGRRFGKLYVAEEDRQGVWIGVEHPGLSMKAYFTHREIEQLAEFLEDHVREVYLAGGVGEDYE